MELSNFQYQLLLHRYYCDDDREQLSKEKMESCLHTYTLHNINVSITLRNTFYFPGYCFQKRYDDIWCRTFEFRYARKTTIRTLLYCCHRLSKTKEININSDVILHSLSFLLSRKIGVEIMKPDRNDNIKKYLDKIPYCSVGHTHKGPKECKKCNQKRIDYERTRVLIIMRENGHIFDKMNLENTKNLNSKQLLMDLDELKHKWKYRRLEYRRALRIQEFQHC